MATILMKIVAVGVVQAILLVSTFSSCACSADSLGLAKLNFGDEEDDGGVGVGVGLAKLNLGDDGEDVGGVGGVGGVDGVAKLNVGDNGEDVGGVGGVGVDSRATTRSVTAHGSAVTKLNKPRSAGCRPRDISISQHQVSGDGIPRFQVAITNTCTDGSCGLQRIMAFCGQFSTACPVNPNVFRRDGNGPLCIVNNFLPMGPGESLTFHYDTEFMEPISLASAQPFCRYN